MEKGINIHPKVSDHPLITKGPLSTLYKDLVRCNACPRIVDFRTRVAKEKGSNIKSGLIGESLFQVTEMLVQSF